MEKAVQYVLYPQEGGAGSLHKLHHPHTPWRPAFPVPDLQPQILALYWEDGRHSVNTYRPFTPYTAATSKTSPPPTHTVSVRAKRGAVA